MQVNGIEYYKKNEILNLWDNVNLRLVDVSKDVCQVLTPKGHVLATFERVPKLGWFERE